MIRAKMRVEGGVIDDPFREYSGDVRIAVESRTTTQASIVDGGGSATLIP